jgi:menaquinone-dependent protoporphyrinogen oxidase
MKYEFRRCLMKKALIAYGTRYGAAAATADTIADVLKKNGMEVTIVDLKREKINDISDYDLIVVGSGIQINQWTKGPRKFLKKHQKDLTTKKLALYVCCGSARPLEDKEDKAAVIEKAKREYLAEKAAQLGLAPVAMGLFGGVYNFNTMPGILKKAMEQTKPMLEKAGIPQTRPGVYDARDMDAIRNWAAELARS